MSKLYLHRADGQLLSGSDGCSRISRPLGRDFNGRHITNEKHRRDGRRGRKLMLIYIFREMRENFATRKQE